MGLLATLAVGIALGALMAAGIAWDQSIGWLAKFWLACALVCGTPVAVSQLRHYMRKGGE